MSRTDTITRAFLRYLYEDSHFRPEVAGFLRSRHAAECPAIDTSELGEVLRNLKSSELIATGDECTDDGLPARAGLTGSGLICAGNYNSDIHAWARHAGTDTTLTAIKDTPLAHPAPPVTIVAARTGPEPKRAPASYRGLVRVCRVLLLALPSVQGTRGEDALVHDAAEELLSVVRAPHPDSRRVRLLARNLRVQLATGPVASTLGIVLLDGFDEAMREAHLS